MIYSLCFIFCFYADFFRSADFVFVDHRMTTGDFYSKLEKSNLKGKGIIYLKDNSLCSSGFFYYMPFYGKYRNYACNKIFGKESISYYGDLYMRPSYDDFHWNGDRVVTISLKNGESQQNGGKMNLSYFAGEKNICFIIILPEKSESISRYWGIIEEAARISKSKLMFHSHEALQIVEEEENRINASK